MKTRYTAQEMRDMAEQILHADDDWYEDAGHMLIQAADMMEREAACEKSSAVGNAAKMREALEQIHELLSIGGKPDTAMCIRYEAAYQIAKSAISVPPSNCDVGTAEEQTSRFVDFCYRSESCTSCQKKGTTSVYAGKERINEQ